MSTATADTMTVWHEGPPPEPNLYIASTELCPDVRRWWDGRRWSAPWYPEQGPDAARRALHTPSTAAPECMRWRWHDTLQARAHGGPDAAGQ